MFAPSSSSSSSPIESEEQRLLDAAAKRKTEKAQRTSTSYLNKAERGELPLSMANHYGLSTNSTSFMKLPRELPANTDPNTVPRWQIELQLGSHRAPVGIEICGDVVLGVDRGEQPSPDLDLAEYGGSDSGVSRRHAVIRPTRSRLYLIDLNSTNGTRVNALPVGPGMAMELRNGDTVSLGTLSFMARIVTKPE